MALPQRLPIDQMQTTWANQINPVLANLLIQGQLLTNIQLANGTTAISHLLQRKLQGWFLVSPQGGATVYQASIQPNPTLTLTLVSSAAITTDLWVF